MNEFIEGDKLEVNENGEIVLVSRRGWVCDGSKPELVNDICPNVHVLHEDGMEGVGYFGILDNKWRTFTKSFKQAAISDYTYMSGSTISDIPVIGWKPIEKQEEPMPKVKLWDRVFSKEFGCGTVVNINTVYNLPYTVLFDTENEQLHDADTRIENMPDNRCYHCTLEDGHPNATIYLSEPKQEVPGSKYEIGDRVKSSLYGNGTVIKIADGPFLVSYDIENEKLYGYHEDTNRFRWETEASL